MGLGVPVEHQRDRAWPDGTIGGWDVAGLVGLGAVVRRQARCHNREVSGAIALKTRHSPVSRGRGHIPGVPTSETNDARKPPRVTRRGPLRSDGRRPRQERTPGDRGMHDRIRSPLVRAERLG